MEDHVSEGNCPSLPLSALRLLVPPLRLVSAAIWQTVQQKAVADYGMLEEFVSMVMDIVPELLTGRQRTQLTLGLRARLILEFCRLDADSEIVQPHLDRMETLITECLMEAGGPDVEVPHSDFVALVKNLQQNSDKRKQYFQEVFPEHFGPSYDEELHSLMWLFLSRLEKCLPLQTFQQVASMLGDVSFVLEDCIQSVSQCEELKALLQCQKHINHLDHSKALLDGACISSALKLPSVEGTETHKPQAQDSFLDNVLSCRRDLESESLALPHAAEIKTNTSTERQTSETKTDTTNWTPGKSGTQGETLRHDEDVEEDWSRLLKECQVQVKRLDVPVSLHSRPVRANRGLRMKKFLLEEKRGLSEEAYNSASKRTKASRRAPPVVSDNDDSGSLSEASYLAPLSTCSEADSWSYYSDEDSCHKTTSSRSSMADSWSYYSDEEFSSRTSVHGSSEDDSFSCNSNEDPSFVGLRDVSAPSRTLKTSDISSTKKTRKVYCFICKEQVNTKLKVHIKTHFPTGDYACPRCDTRFKLLRSLKQHLNRICFEYVQQRMDPERPDESKNLYKCDKCEEAFRSKISLDRHTLTHNNLYCSVCRRVLRDAAMLARHKASHTLYQCNRCEESFTLFKPLVRHCENIHKIGQPFKCNHCPKTFPMLRFLIMHEWHHTGHLPFQCAQCSLRFKSDADLRCHQRVHTREKPYLCAECGKTFSARSNLLRHLKLIHSESRNEKKHSCSQCEKSFKEKGALKKHQRRKHLNELFRSPCPYCGKMVSASTMTRHKLIHTGEKPFKCTEAECEKYFRSRTEVKNHVLVNHTTERPHKCSICGKGFARICYLKSHAKVHSGEKPFVCHICGKAFPKAYSMLRHKKLIHMFITQ